MPQDCVKIAFHKRQTPHGWYWTSGAPAETLKKAMAELAVDRIKEATIGGEQESGFERSFASLAYSYIRDKSPRLIDYLIGFQLLERNPDNTKAVGVFGFKVGPQWLYGPVFFLNGDLKGHELLYVKDSDNFVPMKENWVNYIIAQKPYTLGEGSVRDTYQLGGHPPDLNRLTHPPTNSKYGSDRHTPEIQEWAWPFLAVMGAAAANPAKFMSKNASLWEKFALDDFFSEDVSLADSAFELTKRYPLVKLGFDKFYGRDFFVKVGRELKKRAESILPTRSTDDWLAEIEATKKNAALAGDSIIPREIMPHPLKTGALAIVSLDDVENRVSNEDTITKNLDDLTDEDREKLLRDAVLIKDERDSHGVSVAYNTQVRMELLNPTETGIYEVLTRPGEFTRSLVAFRPRSADGPGDGAVVVELGSPHAWTCAHATTTWVNGRKAVNREEFSKWFDGLGGVDSMTKGGLYMAIGPKGEVTLPFSIEQSLGNDRYKVNYRDRHAESARWSASRYGENERDRLYTSRASSHTGYYVEFSTEEEYHSSYGAPLRINRRNGTSLAAVNGEISVPAEFKILKLKDPPKPKDDEDGDECCCSYASSDDPPTMELCNLADVQMMIQRRIADGEEEKAASLAIIDNHGDVYLKSKFRGTERMGKRAALISLVRDHGLDEPTARELLKEAFVKGKGEWLIKYAEPFYPPAVGGLMPGPSSPAFPAPLRGMERVGPDAVPSIYPQEELHRVPGLLSSQTNPLIYDPFYKPDTNAMQIIQRAAQSGQKEVFDVGMMGGMLKAMRHDTMVDRRLGDLMKAMDSIGRILLSLYWHGEEFEDRYGKADMPELEDSLRNNFDGLGDLILYLKEKTVTSLLDSTAGGVRTSPNIEEVARN